MDPLGYFGGADKTSVTLICKRARYELVSRYPSRELGRQDGKRAQNICHFSAVTAPCPGRGAEAMSPVPLGWGSAAPSARHQHLGVFSRWDDTETPS